MTFTDLWRKWSKRKENSNNLGILREEKSNLISESELFWRGQLKPDYRVLQYFRFHFDGNLFVIENGNKLPYFLKYVNSSYVLVNI